MNNYFSTIGKKTQAKINIHIKITLITSQTKTLIPFSSHQQTKEITLTLSSLDISKAAGPYSIPTKVLKLLKNDISEKLADLFNLSFTTGGFPTVLKTTKVIPNHKKAKIRLH